MASCSRCSAPTSKFAILFVYFVFLLRLGLIRYLLKVEVSPWLSSEDISMKPTVAADEMFPEGAGPYMDSEEAGSSGGLLMDLAANEKAVHADFFNDFEDLFDDEDVS